MPSPPSFFGLQTFSQATRALALLERSDLPHKQTHRALSMLFQNNDLSSGLMALMEEFKALSISSAVMDSCFQWVRDMFSSFYTLQLSLS